MWDAACKMGAYRHLLTGAQQPSLPWSSCLQALSEGPKADMAFE